MQHNMERWYNATGQRFSVRSYEAAPDDDMLEAVQNAIDFISARGVRFVIGHSNSIFTNMFMGCGKIRGTDCYVAMISDGANKHLVGYLGEALILECTALGIGTCWVGGTYKKGAIKHDIQLQKGEKLVCVTPIGIAGEPYSGRPRKDLDKLSGLSQQQLMELPEWQQNALKCARKAPSAVNMQPWKFIVDGDSVTVRMRGNITSFAEVDCGIAMLHIELGASHCGVTGEWKAAHDAWTFTPYPTPQE